MNTTAFPSWIAFDGNKCIAKAIATEATADIKKYVDAHPQTTVAVFDADTSARVELDLRGSLSAVLKRLPPFSPKDSQAMPDTSQPQRRTPGRPKLGVVAREVTLLPRHWEWLSSQTGGASVALRKLVEQARRVNQDADRKRQAQESAYRFMNVMAGNNAGYEEAIRALYANDVPKLRRTIAKWPRDVRDHALSLAEKAIGSSIANDVS